MPAVFVYGPAVVGVVLLVAGLVKALDTMSFVMHLTRFPRLPFGLARVAGPLFLVCECALGAALAVGLWRGWILPVTLGMLVALAAVLVWGLVRGEAEECGCYGRLIHLTFPQSLALDGVYVIVLALGWRTAPELPGPDAAWKIAAVIAAGILAAILSAVSWFSVRKKGRPLIAWGPIRPGVIWNSSWLGHPTRYSLESGEHLVAFLTMSCSTCAGWMSLLRNAVQPHPDLPGVLGVIDLSEEELEELQELLGFPLVAASSPAIRRLTWTLPFGVLVEDGVVREVWPDMVPEAFLDRIRAGLNQGTDQ